MQLCLLVLTTLPGAVLSNAFSFVFQPFFARSCVHLVWHNIIVVVPLSKGMVELRMLISELYAREKAIGIEKRSCAFAFAET